MNAVNRPRHTPFLPIGPVQWILYTLLWLDMKTLWQHTNGQLYAVDHDTFGHIIGAAGPVDPDKASDLTELRYGQALITWIQQAIRRNALRRINPQCSRN